MALDLPVDAREEIAAWRDGVLGGNPDLRLIREDYLHVTLVFLGWQYERDIDRIAEATFDSVAGLSPAALVPTALVPVPKRGARLFALDLDDEDDRSATIQAAAETALAAGPFHEPEKRAFWPHLTLARVKRGRRAPRIDAPAPPRKPFDASTVTLYRSVLRPQGAQYESLRSCAIGELSQR